jgi:type IV secretory pathway VirB4 component
MFNLPNTTVSFQITTPSKDRVLKTLNEFIEELKGKTLKYQKAKEESDVFQQLETLQELVEYVVSDQEQLKEIAVYFKFTAPTKRLLKETELKLLQTAKSRGFQIIKKSLVQQDCFTNFLPSMKTIKTNQIIQTSSLAAFFPFSYHNFLDEKGFFLGGVADGLFVFDLFKRNNYRANSNMFIVGASGQGKSFTTKKIMSQCRLKGAKVVIIDPEREYKIFTQNFGGNWVDVGAGTHGMINPLQIFLSDGKNDLTAHYQFLTAFFQLVLKNLDQKQLAILIDIIKQLYLK